jgi:hypothetical protein
VLTHPLDAAQQALDRDSLRTLVARLTRADRSHVDAMTREHTRAEVYRRLIRSITGPDVP